MKPNRNSPIFLGFSSQKGGVGKSTLAEVVSSILYYEQGINLFVVDCDLSQDSFYKLREREKECIEGSEELSLTIKDYFQKLNKKSYRIIKSSPADAVKAAQDYIRSMPDCSFQLVIFDFPGHAGTVELFNLSLEMDFILSPIEPDVQSLVSCLAYAKSISELGVSMADSRIQDIMLLWNKIDRRVKNSIIEEYTNFIRQEGITLLSGCIYATSRISRELVTYPLRSIFRSTYQPPVKALRTGTGIDELVSELIQRMNLKPCENGNN